jgi:hypothetical protein
MPYIPQAGIGAIGIESGAHVKVADFGPTQTAQFKLHGRIGGVRDGPPIRYSTLMFLIGLNART